MRTFVEKRACQCKMLTSKEKKWKAKRNFRLKACQASKSSCRYYYETPHKKELSLSLEIPYLSKKTGLHLSSNMYIRKNGKCEWTIQTKTLQCVSVFSRGFFWFTCGLLTGGFFSDLRTTLVVQTSFDIGNWIFRWKKIFMCGISIFFCGSLGGS